MKKFRVMALALALVLMFAGLGVFPAAFAADGQEAAAIRVGSN